MHLASFGFVDIRTKRSDLVVEAAAWLAQWGRRVVVHLVGSANALWVNLCKKDFVVPISMTCRH